ncbi:MAG: thiamine phosphate synthase [Burkholderiaceae bacterium]
MSQAFKNQHHRFYPLLDSVERLQSLLPTGIKCVQLRIKNLHGDALLAAVTSAKSLCDSAGCLLVINDHWQAAIEAGCTYVHLGQEDLDTADIAAIRSAGICIGVSTHDDAELNRALSLQADYIALGPVFPTQSKSLHWSAQGLAKVTEWKSRIGSRPLVAIGGITLAHAPDVLAAGADSLAVIGAVTQAPDPAQACRDWLTSCDQASAKNI